MAPDRDEHGNGGRPIVVTGWLDTYEQLAARDPAELDGDAFDLFADALFWLDRPDESIVARRDAYQAHLSAGAVDRATRAAWRLFYDHFLVGEVAVASGWLERARHHVSSELGDASAEAGWLGIAEADVALADGRGQDALHHARRGLDAGRRAGASELIAMALQAEGRALVALGSTTEGVAALDEAMVSVINGELDPLFTGWVYCNVISTCHGLADLRRAAEWSDAALRWCDSLREGHMYPGLCRVYAVELAFLRGAWTAAEADARRACDELTSHDPRFAGEAFYLVGELARLRGDLESAQEAFTRAHELGRVPQPGLGLVRLAQGRAADAAKALRSALQPGPPAPLPRAQILAALVEAEIRVGEEAQARAAADELGALAAGASASPVVTAMAAGSEGAVLLAEGDAAAALVRLREACTGFHESGLPYETAQAHVAIGIAARSLGDADTAALELASALTTFERLGATPDAEAARRLVDQFEHQAASPEAPTPLTAREIEVLRLVADGRTNREIAEGLHVSRHTVARHLSNIFTKIGVTSRASATAYAYEHDLV